MHIYRPYNMQIHNFVSLYKCLVGMRNFLPETILNHTFKIGMFTKTVIIESTVDIVHHTYDFFLAFTIIIIGG